MSILSFPRSSGGDRLALEGGKHRLGIGRESANIRCHHRAPMLLKLAVLLELLAEYPGDFVSMDPQGFNRLEGTRALSLSLSVKELRRAKRPSPRRSVLAIAKRRAFSAAFSSPAWALMWAAIAVSLGT